MHRADIRCRVRYDRGMHCVLALDGESGRPVLEGREQMPALYGREQMTCSLWKRAGGQAVPVGLRERHSGCLRGEGGGAIHWLLHLREFGGLVETEV